MFGKTTLGVSALLLAVSQLVSGQQAVSNTNTRTGITAQRLLLPSIKYSFAAAIPDQTAYPNEFIGELTAPINIGWSAVTIGGGMVNTLIFFTFPDGNNIRTSFRIAEGYIEPEIFTSSGPKYTILDNYVNSTHYQVTFLCQNCGSWSNKMSSGDTASGTAGLTSEFGVWGYAQSSTAVPDKSNANVLGITQHDNNMFGQYGLNITASKLGAPSASYAKWRALRPAGSTTTTTTRTSTTTTTTKVTTTTTTTTRPITQTATPTGTYDYIIIGGGAGGQVMADRLSEAGKQVLLLERGQPSTWAHGGRDGPEWTTQGQLTRYDVPGLCNEIWANSSGIACPDYDNMAGCVLGGGTAINAGLFWKPNRYDFDQFPSGWQGNDIQSSIQKVFSKIPSAQATSQDGKYYYDELHNTVAPYLSSSGFTEVNANSVPDTKNMTFNRPPFMFIKGERGGPLATYMLTARSRSNFKIWFNTMAERVSRSGSQATGVDIVPTANGGYGGNVKLNAGGRVILSAGAFGSPKVLWRSGIGSTDMLQVVAAAEGSKMVAQSQWINLPVGYNLMDHTNTDMVFEHDNIVPYDFYAAWDNPILADKNAYLNSRSGVLATAAPAISLAMHHYVKGTDGIQRGFQWTGRDEGSLGWSSNTSVTLSQYLGTGKTSRGRLTITSNLRTVVSTPPWAQTAADVQAIADGLSVVYKALSKLPGIRWIYPSPGASDSDILNYVKTYAAGRGTNHWMGSCKMGTDDGRQLGGTSGSVVDLNTKVYGMDNLFVVDASIVPKMILTNPTAPLLTIAEQAVVKILALSSSTTTTTTTRLTTTTAGTCGTVTVAGSTVYRTVTPNPVTVTVTPGQTTRTTTTTRPITTTTTSRTSTTTTQSSSNCAAKYGQCGGTGWTGATCCQSGSTCTVSNQYYSQCL
ncbi:hypothetical protein HDV00_001749 [Rhizophlyctis rosea]|nr:hypothetical protein HDV00_001749 [Rhizophlyctis rosea]